MDPKRGAPSRKPGTGTTCNRDTRVSKKIRRWRIGKSGAGATCNKRCCEEKRREEKGRWVSFVSLLWEQGRGSGKRQILNHQNMYEKFSPTLQHESKTQEKDACTALLFLSHYIDITYPQETFKKKALDYFNIFTTSQHLQSKGLQILI
jgi:hypothetical protein